MFKSAEANSHRRNRHVSKHKIQVPGLKQFVNGANVKICRDYSAFRLNKLKQK